MSTLNMKSPLREMDRSARPEARRHPRYAVRLLALIHCHGRFKCATITVVSRSGARLNGCFGLMAGDRVEIELVNHRTLSATLVWSLGGCAGVEFSEPLAADDPVLQPGLGVGGRSSPTATCGVTR